MHEKIYSQFALKLMKIKKKKKKKNLFYCKDLIFLMNLIVHFLILEILNFNHKMDSLYLILK
jgi:hypothetical protein